MSLDGKIEIIDERDQGIGWLGKTQKILKRILYVFHNICEKHKIQYFAIGGTLLGAYRNNSFIPWDADIDIAMMITEYERFRSIVENELPDDIFYQDPITEPSRKDHPYLLKLRDRYSCYHDHEMKDPRGELPGVCLDIFVYQRRGKGGLINLGWKSERPLYSTIFPLKKMLFEGINISVPNKVEEFLLLEYKDLSLPPIEKQYPHEGRVTPYRSIVKHNEALEWYKGTITYSLDIDDKGFREKIAYIVGFAIKHRKNIELQIFPYGGYENVILSEKEIQNESKNESNIAPKTEKDKNKSLLDLLQKDSIGLYDPIFPPISVTMVADSSTMTNISDMVPDTSYPEVRYILGFDP